MVRIRGVSRSSCARRSIPRARPSEALDKRPAPDHSSASGGTCFRSGTSIWVGVIAVVVACGVLAGIARASDTKVWRLLTESAAFPPAFQVPLGVYDPVRHRVLVIDTYNQPLVVHVFDPAPEPHWSTLEVSGIPAQQPSLSSIVYDPVRDRLLGFGGSGAPVMEVWALTLSGPPAWQKLATTGVAPQIRGGTSTVYDPIHDRVILCGGVATTFLSDVWEFSLATDTWSALTPNGVAPGGREGHGAVYDPIGQRMVLFGGHYESGTRRFWNDVWELSLGDTLVWSEMSLTGPIPGARSAFGTIYDPVRHRMLIHGGINVGSGIEPDNLWALSLSAPPGWTEIHTADTLRGRSYPIDAYDPTEDRLLACGGGGYPQTSELSLSAPARWNALLPTRPPGGPSARTGHAVVYDTRRDRFVVIGGTFSSADSAMWSFNVDGPDHWQATRAASYVPAGPLDWFGLLPVVVYDSLGDRIIACDGWQAFSIPAAASGDWTPLGPLRPYDDMSLGLGAGIAIDSRRNRLIVTGGLVPAGHVQYQTVPGVWSLSLGPSPEWSRIGTMPQDCGSAGHASFYDPVHDRLLLLGGVWVCGKFAYLRRYGPTVWSTPLDSLLEWTALDSPAGALPTAPPDAQAAYDPRHGQFHLFADSLAWTRSVDDTAAWTTLGLSTPLPIVTSPVVYDPVRDQVLALFASAAGSDSVQAWAIALGPLSASLVASSRLPDAAQMTWRSTTAIGRSATIERREAPEDWVTLGPLAFDVRGVATYIDHGVRTGHDYTYRVAVQDADSTWHSTPVLVAQPGSLQLALLGGRPNPAVGSVQLVFSLPATGPAQLELFDVRGRRCMSQEVGALGAGMHWLTLGGTAELRPGVYFARLHRVGENRTARVVLIR